MKKLFYLSFIFLALGFSNRAEAQVNLNINIGSQPLWGPIGYDYVRYYYMPEIDVYYDVSNRHYTYYQGNRWITRSQLPGRYKSFNLYRTYKVVLNDRDPWRNHHYHRSHYSSYTHNRSQHVLRDAHRYSVSRYKRDKHVDKRYKKMEKEYRKNHRGRGHSHH